MFGGWPALGWSRMALARSPGLSAHCLSSTSRLFGLALMAMAGSKHVGLWRPMLRIETPPLLLHSVGSDSRGGDETPPLDWKSCKVTLQGARTPREEGHRGRCCSFAMNIILGAQGAKIPVPKLLEPIPAGADVSWKIQLHHLVQFMCSELV